MRSPTSMRRSSATRPPVASRASTPSRAFMEPFTKILHTVRARRRLRRRRHRRPRVRHRHGAGEGRTGCGVPRGAQREDLVPPDHLRPCALRRGATAAGHARRSTRSWPGRRRRAWWRTTSQLAPRARSLIGDERGVTERRMFGGLAFLVDGNMAVDRAAEAACSVAPVVRCRTGSIANAVRPAQWIGAPRRSRPSARLRRLGRVPRSCGGRSARRGNRTGAGGSGPDRGSLAEGVGFEPTVGCPTMVFETIRFGRSRTPPRCPGGRIGRPGARAGQCTDRPVSPCGPRRTRAAASAAASALDAHA